MSDQPKAWMARRSAAELALKVYNLFTEKGKDMKRAGAFSKDDWKQYVISLGCEFTDETFPDSEREIIIRDEHHFTQLKDSKVWDRLIKVDFETAMRIVTLGLP
jgi:hypothetical protein